MADNVQFTDGAPADFSASADDCGADGKVQRVKLTYSANGDATHVPADADGILVNLGANNDVTVTGSVSATQSGNFVVRLQDGTGNALTSLSTGSQRPLTVAIVDGSGNQVTSFTGSGGTSIQDDAAFTAASTSLTVAGGIVTSDSVDSGDAGAFAMLTNRQQKVTLYDSSGNEVSVGGGTQYDEDTQHVSGDKVTLAGVVRVDSPGALAGTDGDRTCLQVDSSGSLRVNVANTVTVASHAVTNAGTFATQVTSIAAGTNNIGDVDVLSVVPGTSGTSLGKAEDDAHTSGHTGVYVLGVRDDTPGPHSGADNDYESFHIAAEGGLWVSETPSALGGWSTFRSLDLDESEEQVKATAGRVARVIFTNTSGATLWLKFYNDTAANVSVGTTTPQLTIGLPGNATDDISGSIEIGAQFSTAITVAATTGLADADTGAPGANECIVNVIYK